MSQKNDKKIGFYESRSGIFFSVETKEEFHRILLKLPNLNQQVKEDIHEEKFDDFDKIVEEVSQREDPK